jgi:hypothetical protein
MKFEVIGPDGACKMSTTYEEYIPYSYLKQMHANGYKFRLDGKIISLSAAMERKQTMIKCLETGEVFKKQADAAKTYELDPALVSDSIKTGKPRGGYTFVKV